MLIQEEGATDEGGLNDEQSKIECQTQKIGKKLELEQRTCCTIIKERKRPEHRPPTTLTQTSSSQAINVS